MVVNELSSEQIDRIFRALADATRRDIVRRTLNDDIAISDLASDYDMSFAAVQKHVAFLEAADLVTKIPHGRRRLVKSNPETLRYVQRLLTEFETLWRGQIDRLDALLAKDAPPE